MDNRTQLTAGAFYCGLLALPFHALFATFQTRTQPLPTLPVIPLFLVLAAVYLLAALLLGRGVALPVLAGCSLLALGGAVWVTLRLSLLAGWGSALFAGLIVTVGWGICLYTAFHPVTVARQLVQCDVVVLCTVWAALIQGGGAMPAEQLTPYPLGVLLSLGCLLALRTFGESREVVCGSRLGGLLLSACLLGIIGGLLFVFVRFLSGGARSALAALLQGIMALLQGLWGALDRFFTWLFSHFAPDQLEGAAPPLESMSGGGEEEELLQAALDPDLLIGLGVVLAAAAAVTAVVLLVRLRKVRLRRNPPAVLRRPAVRSAQRGALGRWLAGLWFQLRFRLLFALHRSSPMGTLVWLERWGRRRHAVRAPGETWRQYFGRLLALTPEESRADLAPLLEQLADCLDRRCFGDSRPSFPAAGRVRALLRKAGEKAGAS